VRQHSGIVVTGTPRVGKRLGAHVADIPGDVIDIRSSTVLPAVREEIEFTTADGVTLVGELALPASGTIEATLITLHPLPTHGGYMDSHIFRKAAWRLPHLADVAVLRFNTRGTSSPRGTSQGAFSEGIGEAEDVRAAVAFAAARQLPNRWLVGWSFGTELALMHGADLDVEGAILLSPPMHRAGPDNLDMWHRTGKPVLALIPEHDDFLPPAQAREAFQSLPDMTMVVVPDAKHLWVGEKFVRIVLNEIVERVAPSRAPIPTYIESNKEVMS